MTPEEISALAEAIASELQRQLPPSVDWSQIDIGTVSNPRPQCGKLDDLTWFKMMAIAQKTYEGSMASAIKTAVYCYLGKTWAKHVEGFQAIAAREGLTLEECLEAVVRGTLKI
jgi:hypothetical protein